MYKLNGLNTNFLARNTIFYNKIDSTQKEIWRRIQKGNIENGTLIISNIQTNGVGTHGRTWYASKEGNIIFSIYIKLNIHIKKIENLTKKIAEIIVQIFKRLYKIELIIKEPNDIVYKNKKIGGILTETKLSGEIVKDLIIGIGINTNKTTFEKEIQDIASSIIKEFNVSVDNEKVITEFCNSFEKELISRIGEVK